MNDSLKRLTAESRSAIVEAVTKQAFSGVMAATKAASEQSSGTFKVIVSTANTDRQGESVNQSGWDLSYFKTNPVVLWAHDYSALPIGVCTSIDVVDGKLQAEGKFAPEEANPFAQQVRRLYELGMVNTTSVGFIPKRFDENNDAIIMEQELLEFSFVPVPANPHALRLDDIKKLGLDVPMLATKGITITEKADSDGDDDAGAGNDHDADDIGKAIENFKTAMTAEHDLHKANHAAAIEEFRKAMKTIDVSKSIDLESMECFKAFVAAHTLEDERHSKAVADHTEVLGDYIADYPDEAEKTAKAIKAFLEEKLPVLIEEKIKSSIIPLIARGTLEANGDKNGAGDGAGSRTPKDLADFNNFIEARSLLKGIDKSVETLLRRFNERSIRRLSIDNHL